MPAPFGPRAGQKVLTLQGTIPRDGLQSKPCADMQGFSLHADVRCDAADRKGLEQLCRYITYSALANERVQCNAAGQVVLKLKTAWRDCTTAELLVAWLDGWAFAREHDAGTGDAELVVMRRIG